MVVFKPLEWENDHGGFPRASTGFCAMYSTLENNDDTWTVWGGNLKGGQIYFRAHGPTLEDVQRQAEEDYQRRMHLKVAEPEHTGLVWERNPALDCETAHGLKGQYDLVRTCFDVSKLWLNGVVIHTDSSTGSHAANRAFAEKFDAE